MHLVRIGLILLFAALATACASTIAPGSHGADINPGVTTLGPPPVCPPGHTAEVLSGAWKCVG